MTTFTDQLLQVCGTTDPLMLKLRGGGVRRYHTEAGLAAQTVAEHSWRVAVIAHHLWPDRPQLVFLALYHDIAEGYTGDMPATTKRLPGMRGALTEAEAEFEEYVNVHHFLDLGIDDTKRLKIADYLELVDTCASQTVKRAAHIAQTGATYVREASAWLPAEEQVRVFKLLAKFLDERPGREDPTGQRRPFGFDPHEHI